LPPNDLRDFVRGPDVIHDDLIVLVAGLDNGSAKMTDDLVKLSSPTRIKLGRSYPLGRWRFAAEGFDGLIRIVERVGVIAAALALVTSINEVGRAFDAHILDCGHRSLDGLVPSRSRRRLLLSRRGGEGGKLTDAIVKRHCKFAMVQLAG
jgi:hypothetical protein